MSRRESRLEAIKLLRGWGISFCENSITKNIAEYILNPSKTYTYWKIFNTI